MTFLMTALQVFSVVLGVVDNSLSGIAAICFMLSTAGVWAAQALDNK